MFIRNEIDNRYRVTVSIMIDTSDQFVKYILKATSPKGIFYLNYFTLFFSVILIIHKLHLFLPSLGKSSRVSQQEHS